jgi:hypothetical protein
MRGPSEWIRRCRSIESKSVVLAPSALLAMIVSCFGVGQGAPCHAQTQTSPDAQPKVAALHEPSASDTGTTNSTVTAAAQPAAKPDPEISLDVAKELAVMKVRIDQFEAELKSRAATEPATSTSVAGSKSTPATGTEIKAPEPTPTTAGVDPGHLTWSLPGLFLLCSRPWLLTTAAEGGLERFGTCPCRPIPRGLPSSVKQLHTTQPFGLSRSWRTLARHSGGIANAPGTSKSPVCRLRLDT